MAEHGLSQLVDFERAWNEFVERLRRYLDGFKGYFTQPWPPNELKEIERLRLDLASRQDTAMPTYRDPLAKFLRTSLLVFSEPLWELIGVHERGPGGSLLLPEDISGDTSYEVDRNRFELNVGEANSEIARHRRSLEAQIRTHTIMLEEAERAAAEARRDDEARRDIGFWQFVWQRIRKGPVGRFLWWFVEDKTRNLLWLGVLVVLFAAVPSLRGCVSRAASWVQTRTDTITPKPKAP